MSRHLVWVALVGLGGCAAGSQFLYVEPNPDKPAAGQGYVDFFAVTPEIDCVWQVSHSEEAQSLLGGKYKQQKRIDSHAYLAEMATPESRLVRAATKPGLQAFSISAAPRLGRRSASCGGGDVKVEVLEGVITPVRLGFGAGTGPTTVLDPIPYRRKESMPYHAAPGPDFDLALAQLAAEVNPNSRRADGSTALTRAATGGRADIVRVLLAAHASPDLAQRDGNTGLLLATARRHADVARLLIDAGANPNLANKRGATPLAVAVQQNDFEMARTLLAAGAEPDVSSPDGASLLSMAIESRSPDLALALINAGAPIDAPKADGASPLSGAAGRGYASVVKAMLQRQSELATNSPAYRRALVVAVDSGHGDVVRALLDAGGGVAPMTDNSPLVLAATRGDASIVSMLLASRFDVSQGSINGTTPLMAACAAGHAEVAKRFIDAGAPVNARAADGSTALMWAAQSGKAEIVRNLIAHRADANARSKNGVSALAVARELDFAPVVSLLAPVTSARVEFANTANVVIPAPRVDVPSTLAGVATPEAGRGDTTRIQSRIAGSDGKSYAIDVVLRSQMMIAGGPGWDKVSVRGPIISGVLYAADAHGRIMPLVADMTLAQVMHEAQVRGVTLQRVGFDAHRLGNVTLYFDAGKVSDVGVEQ